MKTPDLPTWEQLKAWADFCNGLMAIAQARIGHTPPANSEVRIVQEWLTECMHLAREKNHAKDK